MANEEQRLNQLFKQSLESSRNIEEPGVVEQAVATANQQTGLRDIIVLFISSIFALLIGLIGPLCARKPLPKQPTSNNTTVT